jgi:hypothetical protein
VVIHVDALIGFFVVWCHREGSLVGIDIATIADLTAVVARQGAVELIVLKGVAAQESGAAE